MPLLDHFHPPLSEDRHWESFHAAWVSTLADDLNRRLPERYFAEEQTPAFTIIDTLPPQVWTPPAAAFTIPAVFADDFEVRVISTEGGPTLVAAIELVSPRNKDRVEARRAFAIKCASYLHYGISLIVVDIVTTRRANLHTQIMELLNLPQPPHLPPDAALYAVAYQPLRRQGREEIDLWPVPLALGGALPTLPLALTWELYMPIDLEATYMDTRRRRRLG